MQNHKDDYKSLESYEMIDDRGVKDLLSVLLARDSYHQNLWAQAVKELERKEVQS